MENIRTWGWKRDLPRLGDNKYALHPEMSVKELPVKTDLRSQMSPIEDQGRLGSCVAHAVCGHLEFLELKELKDKLPGVETFDSHFVDISRLFVYWNARYLDGDPDVDGGTQLRSAIAAIKKDGICQEYLWPYDVTRVFCLPNSASYLQAKKHKVLNSFSMHNSLDAMKTCLAAGYPFVFGITVYESFMSQKAASSGVISTPSHSEKPLGGHALCCVGYDDSVSAFIVRNSWGKAWGQEGYCLIPYDYLTSSELASDFWTLRKE